MFKSKITHLETNPQHRIKTVYEGILYKAIKEENCPKLRQGQGRGSLEQLSAVPPGTQGNAFNLSRSGSYYPSNQKLKSNSGSQVLACTRVMIEFGVEPKNVYF